MTSTIRKITAILLCVILTTVLCISVCAADAEPEAASQSEATETEEKNTDNTTGTKAVAAAIVVGIVAAAGAVGMAIAISKSVEGMARQPEIAGKINSAMMLGLVFIETAIIYALIVAILVIFVL